MNLRHANLLAFIMCIGIITYHDVKQCHHLPWPARLIKTGLAFIIVDLFGMISEELSAIMSLGLVLAVFFKDGFVADCEQSGTGQPQTTSFIGTAYESQQPPSYQLFAGAQGPQITGQQGAGGAVQ
jgi:hypothetical protein